MSLRRYMILGMLMAVVLPWCTYFLMGSMAIGWRLCAAIAVVVMVIAFVARQIDQNVVTPLDAMAHAARDIAEGDRAPRLLPVSRVEEVARVRGAFGVMQRDLAAAVERQAAMEDERRFFLGAVAHDLRTPLFALRGHLEGLAEGVAATPEKVAHYVTVCREKAGQLDRLVSDLLAVTTLESMADTMHREHVELNAVVDSVASGILPEAAARAVHLTVDRGAGPYAVTGDADWLARAIGNLLDNALRYTPPAGHIRLTVQCQSAEAVIRVADTGPGIAPDVLPHVFEPFYRGDAARDPSRGGSGLGLAIARRVFIAHGGTLQASNGPDGGAVLTAVLPLAPTCGAAGGPPVHEA